MLVSSLPLSWRVPGQHAQGDGQGRSVLALVIRTAIHRERSNLGGGEFILQVPNKRTNLVVRPGNIDAASVGVAFGFSGCIRFDRDAAP